MSAGAIRSLEVRNRREVNVPNVDGKKEIEGIPRPSREDIKRVIVWTKNVHDVVKTELQKVNKEIAAENQRAVKLLGQVNYYRDEYEHEQEQEKTQELEAKMKRIILLDYCTERCGDLDMIAMTRLTNSTRYIGRRNESGIGG